MADDKDRMISERLVKQAMTDDDSAREELWRLVLGTVHNFAAGIGRRTQIRISAPEDIDDVTQDTLITIMQMGPERIAAIRDWQRFLYTVTYRRAIEFIRRRMKHDGGMSIDARFEPDGTLCPLDFFFAVKAPQVQSADRMDREELFLAFLETLPKDSREVVRLYVQGHSYTEIEEQAEIPVNKATIRVYRATQALPQWLADRGIALKTTMERDWHAQ